MLHTMSYNSVCAMYLTSSFFFSDEMYAAIEEPNQAVYTSGSETYAQIRPIGITVAATVNPVPVRTESLQPQQPSTTSLATVKNHTRQGNPLRFVIIIHILS